jgi:hypothetical protein
LPNGGIFFPAGESTNIYRDMGWAETDSMVSLANAAKTFHQEIEGPDRVPCREIVGTRHSTAMCVEAQSADPTWWKSFTLKYARFGDGRVPVSATNLSANSNDTYAVPGEHGQLYCIDAVQDEIIRSLDDGGAGWDDGDGGGPISGTAAPSPAPPTLVVDLQVAGPDPHTSTGALPTTNGDIEFKMELTSLSGEPLEEDAWPAPLSDSSIRWESATRVGRSEYLLVCRLPADPGDAVLHLKLDNRGATGEGLIALPVFSPEELQMVLEAQGALAVASDEVLA